MRMKQMDGRDNRGGFTIVELMIAMAILGVLTASIFSLYNTQHKVTHIESDVIDVQQNLRMALDGITRDLRMAGFALTGGETPVGSFGNGTGLGASDTVSLNTAGAFSAATIINADISTVVSAGTGITFTVFSANEANFFTPGEAARVINPGDKSQPAATVFTVSSINAATPSITMTPQSSAGAVDFKRGFLIVKTGDSAPDTFPNTVQYCLGPSAGCALSVACPAQNCLMRIVNNSSDGASVVASNIQNMQLSYVLDGGSTEAAPADLSQVRDIMVTMTGQTVATAGLSGSPKTREMTASAKLRNR